MVVLAVLAFFVFIFLVVSIVVAIGWMLFVKRAGEQVSVLREEVPGEEILEDDDAALFRDDRLSTLSFWHHLLARFDFIDILQRRINEAGVDASVGRVTLIMLLSGFVTFLILSRFFTEWAVVGGLAAAFAPYGYLLRKRDRRFRKMREAFPDVLDSLARAMRAGYPLSASMDLVGAEAPPVLAVEIQRTAAEANLGMGWPRAMENLGQRVPILEVNLFASAVSLHSRTGGRLSEVLSNLAENLREGIALQGEVRALAAHGKMTGAILTAIPFAIAGMMWWVSPGYMDILINHPWGPNLIGAALACLVIAHFVIRKLVNIRL